MKPNISKNKCYSFMLLLATVVVPHLLVADEMRDLLKPVYNFDQWAGTTKTNYQKTVSDFQPNFEEIGFTQSLSSDNEVTGGENYRRYRVTKPTETDIILDVRISCRNTVVSAHEAMLEFFTNCAAPQPFPSGDYLSLGDKCYIGYTPTNAPTFITFARNTVCISVSYDGGVTNSVFPIAVWLDNSILKLSQ